MTDDTGFGDASTFGGPVQTPALSKLAAEGLRYNRFHTVGLCSPTRAALLSGRNHNRMGFGVVGETSYPGYNAVWKKSTASIADVLRRSGYNTAAFGKWHNTPFREITPTGPFDRWPTGLGFEYYYGNMVGVSSQWEPQLWRNTEAVHQSKSRKEGYHYTTDIADEAIGWIRTQRSLSPGKPYFIYFATGATHSPHHAPAEWIARYKGKFDQGWEKVREQTFARQKQMGIIPANAKLPARAKEVPQWGSLSPVQQRIAAREMEVYAAFLEHTDNEIGRVIDAARAAPGGDNTLVLYIVGDNGAEAGALNGMTRNAALNGVNPGELAQRLDEVGGPKFYSGYSAGWAIASNTPFQWAKGMPSHLGGTRDPLVVAWPARIREKGGLRSQYTHVNDVAGTLFEAAGVSMPRGIDGVEQLPLDGMSFVYSFDDSAAPSRHRQQYYEIWGNRSMYQDGWIASARHKLSWEMTNALVYDPESSYEDDEWELYNLDEDFTQANNLARRYPQRVAQLKTLFDQEARRNDAYPLHPANIYGHMPPVERRTRYAFPAGTAVISYNGPDFSDPKTPGRMADFRIEADVAIPPGGAQGAIVSEGSGILSGFMLYVRDDRLVFEQKSPAGNVAVRSQAPLPSGKVTLGFAFVRDEGADAATGTGRIFVNGQPAGEARMAAAPPPKAHGYFSVGEVFSVPVGDAIEAPFKFTGRLEQVRIELE